MHVSIVGGGIIGLSTAFEFLDAGYTVTVYDPSPATGATHHAGGMLAPTAEVQYQQQDLIPLMFASAELYPSLIQRVSQYTDLPTGYRTEGTFVAAADRADAQHLTDLTEYLRASGIKVETPTTRQARREEPALTPNVAKLISIPGDHQVAPRLFAKALLDAIKNRGATVKEEKVTELPSGLVVLAAGLGAAELDPRLRLRPVYGDVLNLHVPESMQPLLTRVVRGFVEDRPVYLIPRDNGLLTIGATSREDSPAPRTGAVYDLLRDAIRLVPGIEECEFVEATCGARPGTPDDLPYIGRDGDIIISTGYFRHGILLAALGAKSAVALAENTEPPADLSACDPFRF